MTRSAEISRKTRETDITLSLALDGTGEGTCETGIGFFVNAFRKGWLYPVDASIPRRLSLFIVYRNSFARS